MANWGPKKMCPRSGKVGRLTGNEKHLVTACCSESMPQRVTGVGQPEKQRRSLWGLHSHRGAALLGCPHMSSEIGLLAGVGCSWERGLSFLPGAEYVWSLVCSQPLLAPCCHLGPSKSQYSKALTFMFRIFFLFVKRANTYKGASFLPWARCARNALFILRAKCFCRDNWTKLRMAHHDRLYHVYLRKFINSYYIREYVN